MHAPVQVRVSVRFVARVDHGARPGRGGAHSLPHVVGPRREAVVGALGRARDAARARHDLSRLTKNGNSTEAKALKSARLRTEIVLVAAVTVARRVGVVLVQVDGALDAQRPPAVPLPLQQGRGRCAPPPCREATTSVEGVAFRGRVLGMRAHVDVEARAVGEEHVRRPSPLDHRVEQVPRHLFGCHGARVGRVKVQAKLGLQAHDRCAPDRRLGPAAPRRTSCGATAHPFARTTARTARHSSESCRRSRRAASPGRRCCA